MIRVDRIMGIGGMLLCGWILLSLAGCAGRKDQQSVPVPVYHLALLSRPGASLYVDRIDNRSVLRQQGDTGADKRFYSFLVGSMDSIPGTDARQLQERQRYFQYTIQKDWVALANGDSILPVLYQEKAGLNNQLMEGVLVFEIPRGAGPDTLVYRDSFGSWGTALIVLNRK